MIRKYLFPHPRKAASAVCTSFAAGFLWSRTALAQTANIAVPSQPFSGIEKTDLAQAWIDYLFRGNALPDTMAAYAAPLSFAADGLRQALGIYSIAMLTLAAMLVFYHLAAMVVETAHSGVPFGRRANQIWMPIRFVIAISLLVPVSSSLSAGQYLVLKIASEGSVVASNAWRTIASAANGHLSGLVTPRGPDVAHLAATAVEMETCRAIYQQIYAALDGDTTIHVVGGIGDVVKSPADRFTTETWRYSNILNANVPLCGEYRFPGYRRSLFGTHLPTTAVARMAEDLSTFAHSQADDLQTQARTIGDRTASAFLSPAAPIGADVHSELATLETNLTNRLNAERQEMGVTGAGIADQTLSDSADAGWLAAASFIPEFVRLQDSYSELIDNALPVAQSPIFAHQRMAQKVLNDAVAVTPYFLPLEGATPERLTGFYGQTSRLVTQLHLWLYGSQLPDKDFVAPASADLLDRLNAATDPDAISSFFTQGLDAAAFTYGVWGEDPDSVDTGYPFATVPPTAVYNPFAALVEFGRRQVGLASELAGLAGSGLATPGATGPSVLFGVASLCFFIGGIVLIFVVPLLPFLRFLIAALAWAINVFEAVVSVPVVAIAHLTPVGGGLSGSLARQAYMLWLSLLVRPVLTLLGFVFGLLVFVLSLAFLDAVLTPFARLAMPSNGGLLVGANMGLVFVYDVLAYAAANASFKGIHWLPEQALRWTSRFVITDPGETPTSTSSGGGGPSSVTAFIAPSGGGSIGGTTVNVSSAPASGGASAGSSESHSMKMALFPSYGDKPSTGPAASGGAAVQSSTVTHFADRSVPGSPSVHVTGSMSMMPGGGGVAGPARNRDGKPDKKRLSGIDHEATMGGRERTGGEKDGARETPKETPSGPQDGSPKE